MPRVRVAGDEGRGGGGMLPGKAVATAIVSPHPPEKTTRIVDITDLRQGQIK